jgi:hypothetical protein
MEPGMQDKNPVDWSLVAMGAAMLVSAAYVVSHLV